ncbi:MAG TPA: hypothetical protein PLG94_17515 [Smithellaceae bacterium]|nr:hypothetical protein [Syntrophales bacterium]HPL68338.1 hypothetical protein [Smithellaceae bacterium]HQG81702.1 hypothetical protein [Smithellaceae bacterium]HRR48309.1 hypothetical protein [Syntrophales bacterium]
MSKAYEKAKEILQAKAIELGVDISKLNANIINDLNRARYIDALLLQNKSEHEIIKYCSAKGYGAVDPHYRSIISDADKNRLDARVRTRLLSMLSFSNKNDQAKSSSSQEGFLHYNADSEGEIPSRNEIEAIMRNIGREVHEDILKETVKTVFATQKRKLRPDWWEITKKNLEEWSKKG